MVGQRSRLQFPSLADSDRGFDRRIAEDQELPRLLIAGASSPAHDLKQGLDVRFGNRFVGERSRLALSDQEIDVICP